MRYLYFFVFLSFNLFSVYSQIDQLKSKKLIKVIEKVNNYWQSTHPEHGGAFWDIATYHTGNLAAYRVTGNEAYLKFSEAWAEKNHWKGATSDDTSKWSYKYGETSNHVLFGDWQICFQVYADFYKLKPDERKIARARQVMEYQMSTPQNDYWWWIDGLYMVMPVMTKLYSITDNDLYLKKLYEYFSYARDLMYDRESGLFYRDAKYIYPNHMTNKGFRDFWARGNGWIFAAIPKVLEDLPLNDPNRDEYITIYKKMAQALSQLQQPEGYWTRSLLDPAQAPGPETSGTAFYTFGYLWGINHGILEVTQYKKIIAKSWKYLTETSLQPNGMVGYVQPIGERAVPGQIIDRNSTANFGVGAFLLAASEMVNYQNKR